MRSFLFLLPIAALCGCAPPAPQSGAAAPVAAPFDVPMDPGLIRCGALNNPLALSAATDWALGQARAAALAGRITGVPDAPSLSNSLATYCSANGGDSVRTAAAQLGI
jgi:hypothetical protein